MVWSDLDDYNMFKMSFNSLKQKGKLTFIKTYVEHSQ